MDDREEVERKARSAKRIRIALAIAFVWSAAWGAGSYGFFSAAASARSETDALLALPRGAEPGRDARFEATVAQGPTVTAPFSARPCIASVTRLVLSGTYRDQQDRPQSISTTAVERRSGPPTILLDATSSAGAATHVEVAAEAWKPTAHPDAQKRVDEAPASLDFSSADMASARKKFVESPSNGRIATITDTSVEEWLLTAGATMFVVGHVEERDGHLRVTPSQALGKLIVVPGTEDAYLLDRRGDAKGFRIAGWVFVGLASLPWLFALLLVAHARRKRDRQEMPELR